MTDFEGLPLPTAEQKEVSFLSRRGNEVILRLIDTDRFEVKVTEHPDYTAVLTRRAPDDFELQPVRDVDGIAVDGVTAHELWERF